MPKKANALDRAKPSRSGMTKNSTRAVSERQGWVHRSAACCAAAHLPGHPLELNRRKLLHAADIIRDTLEEGVAILGSILRDPEARDADKLKATEMLMDRAWGKPLNPIIVGRVRTRPSTSGSLRLGTSLHR
jgi:hypothetical protein